MTNTIRKIISISTLATIGFFIMLTSSMGATTLIHPKKTDIFYSAVAYACPSYQEAIIPASDNLGREIRTTCGHNEPKPYRYGGSIDSITNQVSVNTPDGQKNGFFRTKDECNEASPIIWRSFLDNNKKELGSAIDITMLYGCLGITVADLTPLNPIDPPPQVNDKPSDIPDNTGKEIIGGVEIRKANY